MSTPALALVPSPATDVAAAPASSPLTREQAQLLTDDARAALGRVEQAARVFAVLIARAWDGKAHRALGYPSWAAYTADAFGPLAELRIPVAARAEQIEHLTTRATNPLSLRGAAAAFGIADQTARADRKRVAAARAAAAAAADPTPAAPAPTTKTGQALADLLAAGAAGLTSTELGRLHRSWSAPWAVLSELHAQLEATEGGPRRRVQRLAQAEPTGTRRGMAVYVHPSAVAGRDVEAPGRRSRRTVAARG